MPNWKKILVSGSDASLNSLVVTNGVTITGSLSITGSSKLIGDSSHTGSVFHTGSKNLVGIFNQTGSMIITGSTTQIGNNSLFGNTTLSGSIIISGSTTTPATPTIKVYGDIETNGVIKFDPVVKSINNTITGSYIFVSGSTNDLYFSQNGSGYSNVTRLRWLEGNLYTGLLNGGLIGSSSSTVYTVQSGSGIIVNLNASIANNPFPIITYVNWPTLSASIAPLSSSYDQSFIGIDVNGQIYAQGTPLYDGQVDTYIPVGVVLHQNHSTINGVATQPSMGYGWKQRSNIFISAFGPLKLSGYTLAVSGSSTGSLIVTSGTAFLDGGNYQSDPNNPSYITGTGTTTSKIFRYYDSGSDWVYNTNAGAGFGAIDPTRYSNNGVLTAVPGTGANKQWSIQRVFFFPTSPLNPKPIVVYYGNATYATQLDAVANISIETFVEAPNTAANAIYLGSIIVRNDANFTNTGTFSIIPGGLFRQVGGSGGGGSVVTQTLAGLSDVLISGLTDGQALVYDSTALKWENKSNISASITGNATTATTASYAATASFVVSSSYSITSSYSNTSTSASYSTSTLSGSYALTASYVANNIITASVSSNTITFTKGDGTTFPITVATGSIVPAFPFTGSALITGSLTVTGSVNSTGGYTGSLLGTASFASTALSASYATAALSSSFATSALSASYSLSSSYSLTSSYALTASFVANDIITASVSSNTITFTKGNGTTFPITIATGSGGTGTVTNVATSGTVNGITLTGGPITTTGTITLGGTLSNIQSSQLATSSLMIGSTNISLGATASSLTGLTSVNSTAFTGSLLGTASFASSALSASFASSALSSSFATTSISASFASTASFVNTLNQNVIITGSVAIGTSSLGPSENSITLGARDSANEGGQIGFNAPGGTFTSASFIDNWSNKIRILKGNNTTSTGLVAQWDLQTTQMQLAGYTAVSSFPGTATANLAVDSGGNVITVSTSGGTVFPYTGNAVITGSLTTTGVIYAQPNGGMYFQGGDDAALYDINVVNTMGVYGVQDSTVGSIKLGSGGGTISGKSGNIGIGTINPTSASLTVNGNVWANSFTGSLLGTSSYTSQAATASYVLNAITASYVLNAVSASYATSTLSSSYTLTASYVANDIITASVSSNTITFTKGNGTTFPITIVTGSGTVSNIATTGTVNGITLTGGPITTTGTITLGGTLGNIQSSQLATSSLMIGSTNIALGATASLINGLTSLSATSFTGSLLGTASYASQALSSSFASTASYVATAQTASYVLNAVSASYATSTLSASYALTASYVANDIITASVSSNIITFTKGNGTTFPITVATGSGAGGSTFPYTGSAIISGSLSVTGSVGITSTTTLTGQLNANANAIFGADIISNGTTIWQGKNALVGTAGALGGITSYITTASLASYSPVKFSGETMEGKANGTLVAGQLCYFRGSGWDLADASAVGTTSTYMLGVCLKSVSSGASSIFLLRGFVQTPYTQLTDNGEPIYMDGSFNLGNGYMSFQPPFAGFGYVTRIIGDTYDAGTQTIRFNPDNTWIVT